LPRPQQSLIILWSVANETPNTEARTKYLTTMVELAHELDPTRLVTAALLVRTEKNPDDHGTTKIVDDPLGKALDVIGTNEYIGWYEQHAEGADTTTWDIRYDKPLIMSEWGGDAKAGNHAGVRSAPALTEEYQAEIYRHQIPMLNKIPQLRGTSPRLLMDSFRLPRQPGLQDNFNCKGLIPIRVSRNKRSSSCKSLQRQNPLQGDDYDDESRFSFALFASIANPAIAATSALPDRPMSSSSTHPHLQRPSRSRSTGSTPRSVVTNSAPSATRPSSRQL
jgi:hypothetical protein